MRATCFISPSDTLNASLNAVTSSLVMTPSALAIFALRAITPTVKGTSLSADRSRGLRSTSAAPPNSVLIEASTGDCATADASLSQMDIEILPGLQLVTCRDLAEHHQLLQQSLQTKMQTNHAAQHGIGHHKRIVATEIANQSTRLATARHWWAQES